MKKLICAVHNDEDNNILSCKIVEKIYVQETNIIKSKEKIIKDIEDEDEYFTALWEEKETKRYVQKSKIKVIKGENGKYLRSDNNNTEEDNLDELPTF